MTARKVPALALVIVGLVGMVAGVLAASVTITQSNFTGESGIYRTNSGTMTINDQGLSIVTDVTGISSNTTATFGASSSNKNLFNGAAFTAGHWMETITLTDTAADSSSHTVTIKVVSGAGVPTGTTTLASVTLTLTGPGSSSTGTITDYIDLGVTSITAPMSVYVSST
ncbi:hypothetical protein J2P12_06165 [Candidatus Bathyarchaeota archaeon]|nr:hypothetical protein [Candidatus Bathyarchaeota archaeon]